MEFTDPQIARLVLGYLKSEKCKSAYNEFLKTSPHFKDEIKTGRTKYLITRVSGLSLADYLHEYTDIYTLVQGRLEVTNYFNENHSRTSLLEQLLYLLDKIQSRGSTPCPRTPDIHMSTPIDHCSDVEATPAHTLPGNVGCEYDDYLNKTPKRRRDTRCNKSDTFMTPEKDNDKLEVLTKTLIENKEFTEKLAQTINIVRSTPETVEKKSDECISAGAYAELDATIKTVVRKTEEDPMFDKILDEIIGTANIENNNESNRHHSKENIPHTKEKANSSKYNQNLPSVEELNNEAIRNIIVASNSKATQKPPNSCNSEVIVFDGSFDNYLKTSTQCNLNVAPQKEVYPSSGYLVVPNQSNVVQYDPTKQIYLLNNQQLVNIPQIKTTGNVISEQDILAMPTVIVNDEIQNKITSQQSIQIIQSQPVYQSQIMPVPIASKGHEDLHSSLGEYIRLYKSEEVTETTAKTSTRTIKTLPPKARPKGKKKKNVTLSVPSKVIEKPTKEVKTTPSSEIIEVPENSPKVVTVEIKDTPERKEAVKKSTPKSGSHVRNLNFSTPPKITSTGKKKNSGKKNKSPTFIHKKQAAKTLFKHESDSKPTKKLMEKKPILRGDWDSELRALAAITSDMKSATPKRKPKPSATAKRKGRKSELNTTDNEALLLEAALQTPMKNDLEKPSDNSENNKKSDSTTIKDISVDTVVKEEVNTTATDNPVIQIETHEDASIKTILSPSKLNANKRNLVETKSNKETDPTITSTLKAEESSKMITPESSVQVASYPIKANRNITPMLETPIKTDGFPKTPGLRTPITGFTPFNKVLDEQLQGVDINSIETPNLPITPNFPPFTPSVDLISPYANRPTDYSGSSSYYQPSDNEQNKSIEQLLEETQTTSKKTQIKILNDVVIKPKKDENLQTIQEHKNIFNKNIIGKKNLNLVKRNMESSSSSPNSSSSSEDNDSDSNWTENTNQTVICKNREPSQKALPTRTYSLRNRSNSAQVKAADTEKTETNGVMKKSVVLQLKDPVLAKTTEINNILSSVEPTTTLERNPIKIRTAQEKILMELKEKRERVISKFKDSKIETSQKSVPEKHKQGRLRKKIVQQKLAPPKVVITPRKNRRKSDSPKKAIDRNRRSSSENKATNNKDKSFSNDFILSSDEESEKPVKMETRSQKAQNKLETCKLDKNETASDVEAEKLVTGLKQRGIHLMYNKSPKTPNLVAVPSDTSDVDKSEKIEDAKLETSSSAVGETINKSDKEDAGATSIVTVVEPLATSESTVNKCDNLETSIAKSVPSVCDQPADKSFKQPVPQTEMTPQLKGESSGGTPQRIFTERSEEQWSTVLFHEEIIAEFDDSKIATVKQYDVNVLSKKLDASIYFDYQDIELPVKISVSQYADILDMPSKVNVLIPKRHKDRKESVPNTTIVSADKSSESKVIDEINENTEGKAVEKSEIVNKIATIDESALKPTKSEDELMNFAIVGSAGEPSTDDSNSSPKGSRKRKAKNDDNLQVEKKSKTCENILKNLDVDIFLNKVHGQN